jgi:manganese/iron transport system permease protein
MMAWAAFFGLFSSVAGLYASYYLDIASGSAIVLAATSFFLVAFFLAPRRG